jgi:4-alpha-glucanotransferase
MPEALVTAALASVARLAIVPLQDILGLGQGHRMNAPGTTEGNWGWRFDWSQLTPSIISKLNEALSLYGRVPD